MALNSIPGAKFLCRLWESFYLLIVAKCIRYYENHGRGWHYEPEPLDGQAEETVDRDALNGAVDHVLGLSLIHI